MRGRDIYLMALDIGGGSGRCVLLNPGTNELRAAGRTWTHPRAPGTLGLGYDLELPVIWQRLGEASREVMSAAGAEPEQVAAVAVTSMRNTTVVLDSAGRLLMGTPNSDGRAVGESYALGAERGAEFHRVTGHWPGPVFTAPRLIWMKNNHPGILEDASVVLNLSDWAAYRLCGSVFAERSQSGETLLFDQASRDWSFELIESLGLTPDIFPQTVDAGTVVGEAGKEASRHLGIAEGVPVVAAGADTQCGLLGAGVVEPGQIGVIAGTSMPVQQIVSEFNTDSEGRLWSGQHVIPGLFVIESNGLITGAVLEWFAGILHPDLENPLNALLAEAECSETGAGGVFSTLGAGLFDARNIGIPVGDLTLSHMVTPGGTAGRSHISRAVLEGIAFSAVANIEQVIEATGRRPPLLRLAGGMSRSALFDSILSETARMRVEVPGTVEVSALGAAVCAGVGVGVYGDLASGAAEVSEISAWYEPGEAAGKCQQLYSCWKDALGMKREADGEMSGLMTAALLDRGEPADQKKPEVQLLRIRVTATVDETALEGLRSIGEVNYRPWRQEGRVYGGGSELAEFLDGYDVFVTEMDIVDFPAIRDLPRLKVVACCRGNPVNVDTESATAFGVAVFNTPGRNADAVADLAVSFMVMLARKMPDSLLFLRDGEVEEGDLARMGEAYGRFQGNELWRKTVGIVGLGSVGKGVARRVLSFGAKVKFFDPGVGEGEGALAGAQKVGFEQLLAQSDFLTLHAPDTPGTRGMMDSGAFDAMKNGAFFVNTARASLVDMTALADAIDSGRLAGAALDVFPVEPPGSNDRLVASPKVITTPHIGGNSFETAAHQGASVVEQLHQILTGRTPDHLLNPEVMDSFSLAGPRPEPSEEELERLSKKDRPKMTS